MKKKIYAVWFPGREKKATFFEDWESCKPQVTGVSGIRYRGFPDRRHAEEFLGIVSPDHDPGDGGGMFPDTGSEQTLIIYVDGSYMEGYPYAGWAWVALSLQAGGKEKVIGEDSGITSQPAVSRNIDGEITAVSQAVKWVDGYLGSQKNKKSDWEKTHVAILYDYLGIAAWAQGRWKAKTPLTQDYQRELHPYRDRIQFLKVSAHAGKYWNEYVDRLAKEAVRRQTRNF